MAGPATMCSFSIEMLCGVMYVSASTTATNIVPLITPSNGCTVVPEFWPVRLSFVYVVLSCETHATYAGGPMADVFVVYERSGPTGKPGLSHSRLRT